MSRRPAESELQFGSDSFLDVIANIVGILIILTVIVGLRVARQPVLTGNVAVVEQLSPDVLTPEQGGRRIDRDDLLNRQAVQEELQQKQRMLREEEDSVRLRHQEMEQHLSETQLSLHQAQSQLAIVETHHDEHVAARAARLDALRDEEQAQTFHDNRIGEMQSQLTVLRASVAS
ncbi:MAG: hypothetical protein KDA96_12325, partial [Planctomycetaceae bacterium]|nr:hypothetical protein [Planctomycetaceae bacterium]